jgi:hypothetical protein
MRRRAKFRLFAARRQIEEKLRGGGELTCAPEDVTRSTARPRSLVPSARNQGEQVEMSVNASRSFRGFSLAVTRQYVMSRVKRRKYECQSDVAPPDPSVTLRYE